MNFVLAQAQRNIVCNDPSAVEYCSKSLKRIVCAIQRIIENSVTPLQQENQVYFKVMAVFIKYILIILSTVIEIVIRLFVYSIIIPAQCTYNN